MLSFMIYIYSSFSYQLKYELSYAWSLSADRERLKELRKRVNIMPLGSGALAGNPFSIDRDLLARLLGFDRISHNSLLAVSDRDFVGILIIKLVNFIHNVLLLY